MPPDTPGSSHSILPSCSRARMYGASSALLNRNFPLMLPLVKPAGQGALCALHAPSLPMTVEPSSTFDPRCRGQFLVLPGSQAASTVLLFFCSNKHP